MIPMKIVLAGQPNVGKSSLINAMSDARLKVGNFSGVTVEKTEICFEHHCHQVQMIDLPGTYSINGFTKEEEVARNYLQEKDYDVIINVVDCTHLTRNLLLTLELLKLNKKMVIALNMYDEAKKEGLEIDVKQIEALIGIPTVAVSSVFVFKGEDEPFVMEMPKYRFPTLKLIYMIVSQKAWSYLKKAGTFILDASMIIWFASNYPKVESESTLVQLEQSYLG